MICEKSFSQVFGSDEEVLIWFFDVGIISLNVKNFLPHI